MFTALLPKGAPFFELLLQQNEMLCSASSVLLDILEGNTGIDKSHHEISRIEADANDLTVTILKHLSQTFITPIDREDILHINKAQEESIDFLHNMANRFVIFEFARMRFPMLQLARTVKSMVLLTKSMLEGLSQRRDRHHTREFHDLRRECEMLLSMGLRELYDLEEATTENVLTILKWSQTYDRMELAVDQVVDLAEAIEEAVLKNV
jgi:uncharacterized protein Yka (UPF0111/DUF47 family)